MTTMTEADAATTLGVSRDDLKKLRAEHLYEKDDWEKKGREIVITMPGLERLRGLLQRLRTPEAQDSGQQKKPAPDAIPGVVTAQAAVASALGAIIGQAEQQQMEASVPATVVKVVLNPHIVLARLADQTEISVWVKSNKNFLPGMTLRAAQRVGTLYDLVGRCPRFRGKW